MKKLAITLSVGAASLLSMGAAMTIPTTAEAQPVVIQVAPPPPRFERVPPPRRGYVWAPGHYECKRRLRTPLDAGSSKDLQQVALAAVDLVDERLI